MLQPGIKPALALYAALVELAAFAVHENRRICVKPEPEDLVRIKFVPSVPALVSRRNVFVPVSLESALGRSE
jgi:hypothetical protein